MPTKLAPIQIPAIPARTLYPELSAAQITIFAKAGEMPIVEVIYQRIDRDDTGEIVQAQPMDPSSLLRFTLSDFVRLVPELANLPADIAKGIALIRQRQADEIAFAKAMQQGAITAAAAVTPTTDTTDTTKDTP